MKIKVKIISYATNEYRQELLLRDKFLRKPIGMSLFDEDLSKEIDDCHIGAFSNEKLIGVLILSPVDEELIKIRQVTVDETYRGKGIGTEMIKFAESHSLSEGYKRIVMHARKFSVGFYIGLGYEIMGEEFMEVTIPHYKIQKELECQ